MTHLLIADRFTETYRNRLAALPGVRLHYLPDAPRAEHLAALGAATVLLQRSSLRIDTEALAHAPNLRLILRAGVGLEHIDEAACAARGIAVVNTAGANANAVAEAAVGTLLSLLGNLAKTDRELRAGVWERSANRGTELGSLTVGVIGYGNIGRAVVPKLAAFGCRVLAYDKYLEGFMKVGLLEEVQMPRIFAEADVLSLHIPLTDETQGLVDAAFLARFAKPIWLLNLARGGIVNTADLLAALTSGRVRGAGLDVFEQEPPFAMPEWASLAAHPGVLLTPHIAGWSHQSLQNEEDRLYESLKAYLGL